MGDELKADRKTLRRGDGSPPEGRAGYGISMNGSTHRVDPSHQSTSDTNQIDAISPAEEEISNEAVYAPESAQETTSTGHFASRETDLLLQASQIAEHLRSQIAELDRRDQTLNEQLAVLDRERRSARLWLRQSEEDIQDRELRLKLQESELADRIDAIEKITGELQDKEQELVELRDRLDGERAGMRESVGRELAAERNSLHRAQQLLQTERELLAAQMEQHRREHEAALARLEQRFEEERRHLREEVRAEVQSEFSELASHQAEWLTQRDAELAEIAREREISDEACRQTEDELSSLREKELREFEVWKVAQLAEFDQQRQQHERSIRVEREAFEKELAARQQQWIATRDADRMQLECDRESSEANIERAEAELETVREAHLDRMRREQDEHVRALRDERAEFESKREQQLAEIRKERTLLDNRMRFQQEHLEKMRAEIEDAQREFRNEQQQARLREEEAANQQRLRAAQFDRYRSTLEERETSIFREQQMIAGMKQTVEQELHQERQRLADERSAWEREREAQTAEIRRQQNMLTLHGENLESRRSRLDQLRNELEATHRETLEMRTAVEDAWAQFTQEAGAEPATERFDNARADLVAHFTTVSENLARQHSELAQAQNALETEREEFRKERANLTDWISERDEQLRRWEQRLAQQSAAIESRDVAGRGVRDDWTREKMNAERIIRDLLAQVADLTGPDTLNESHITSTADGIDEDSADIRSEEAA